MVYLQSIDAPDAKSKRVKDEAERIQMVVVVVRGCLLVLYQHTHTHTHTHVGGDLPRGLLPHVFLL